MRAISGWLICGILETGGFGRMCIIWLLEIETRRTKNATDARYDTATIERPTREVASTPSDVHSEIPDFNQPGPP